MDFTLNTEAITHLIQHYGSVALFILLVLGIIALPVPEETLLVVTGVLMGNGYLNIPFTLLAAYFGSMVGITISYLIGMSVGIYFINKYGGWVGLTETRLEKISDWFHHYGKWTLVIGYFIPGVRHLTGITAGLTRIEYHQFALFAYFGAIIWVSTFLSIGYFCRHACVNLVESIDINITEVVFIALFSMVVLFVTKKIIYRNNVEK